MTNKKLTMLVAAVTTAVVTVAGLLVGVEIPTSTPETCFCTCKCGYEDWIQAIPNVRETEKKGEAATGD